MTFFHLILIYLAHRSFQMVDYKNKTSPIRHVQKNTLLMKINNIMLLLLINIILLSSFMIYFFYATMGNPI